MHKITAGRKICAGMLLLLLTMRQVSASDMELGGFDIQIGVEGKDNFFWEAESGNHTESSQIDNGENAGENREGAGSDIENDRESMGSDTENKKESIGLDTGSAQGNTGLDAGNSQGSIGLDAGNSQGSIGLDAESSQGSIGLDAGSSQGSTGLDAESSQGSIGLDAGSSQGSTGLDTGNGSGSNGINGENKGVQGTITVSQNKAIETPIPTPPEKEITLSKRPKKKPTAQPSAVSVSGSAVRREEAADDLQTEQVPPKKTKEIIVWNMEYDSAGEKEPPLIQVNSCEGVRILSLRWNKAEVSWYWKEGGIYPVFVPEKGENTMELLAVCEKEDRVTFCLSE